MNTEKNITKKLEAFLDKNIDYYKLIFFEMENRIIFSRFNNAALIFGSFWFFYRKLYVFGSVLFLSPFIVLWVISAICEMMGQGQYSLVFLFFIYISIRFLIGYLANRIYWLKWNYYRHFIMGPLFLKLNEGTSYIFPILILLIVLIFIPNLLIVGIRHY